MKTWFRKALVWPVALGTTMTIGGIGAAEAQNLAGSSFEARFGAFTHGVGSHERGTADLQGSIVTPRLLPGIDGPFKVAVPRLRIGGALNLSGRTSFAFADFLWTVPILDRFFLEGSVGPAIHSGSLVRTPTLAGLGCPVLFHAGASVGYRANERWSVMATFEHLSNGKGVFGIDCGTNTAPSGSNEGLNNYGFQFGFSF